MSRYVLTPAVSCVCPRILNRPDTLLQKGCFFFLFEEFPILDSAIPWPIALFVYGLVLACWLCRCSKAKAMVRVELSIPSCDPFQSNVLFAHVRSRRAIITGIWPGWLIPCRVCSKGMKFMACFAHATSRELVLMVYSNQMLHQWLSPIALW